MDEQFSLQQAIDEHLDLRTRNAGLEPQMPLALYREQPPGEQEPDADAPDEQALADPWRPGLWTAPGGFDWGD